MKAHALICAAALSLATACQDRDGTRNTQDDTAMYEPAPLGVPTGMPGGPAPGEASSPAQAYVNTAAAANMFEIEAGKIAADKASNDRVRFFANQMIAEHGKAQAELHTAVTAADHELAMEPRLDPDQQAQLAALRESDKGEKTFDAVYIRQQRAAHDKALAMLHGYAMDGDIQPLRENAQNAAETVTRHLALIRKLPAP